MISSSKTVELKKNFSFSRLSEVSYRFQLPLRSPAYNIALPSGLKETLRSCSGVFVIRFVVPSFIELTNTSPRLIKAISFPLDEIANSLRSSFTGSIFTGRLRKSERMSISISSGSEPSICVNILP